MKDFCQESLKMNCHFLTDQIKTYAKLNKQ
jgi:hypothetical protein